MEVYLSLALNCLANGQFELASDYLRSAESINGEKTPQYYHVKGTFFLKKLDYKNALEQYQHIPQDENHVFKDSMHSIAEAYRKLDLFNEALEVAEKAVQFFPDYYKSYSVKGFVLSDLNKHQEAIAEFKTAIEKNPQAKEAKQGIVWSHCKLNDYDQTMKLYKAHFEKLEKDSKYLQYKAKLLSNFGKYDEAMNVIDKILDREPYNPKYQRDAVICYYHLGKFDKCIEEGEVLINIENLKLREEMAQLNFYVALSYAKRDKNNEKYEYHMQKFKDAVPDNKRNKEFLIEEARRLFEQGKSEEGMKVVNRVLETEPKCLPAIIMKVNHINLKEEADYSVEDKQFLEQNKNYKEEREYNPNEAFLQSQIESQLASTQLFQLQTKSTINYQQPSQINQSNNDYSLFMGNNININFNNETAENITRKKRIGEGGFSIVYTQEMPDGKIRAFKEFKSQNDKDKNKELQLIKDEELEKLKKLNHPNIVKYLGFYMNIMIMEYCEGQDLHSILITQRIKLPVKLKYRIIQQIAEALNYVHDMNIVHCDIKTKNILLDKKYDPDNWPNAKLCDFGLSINSEGSGKMKGFTINYAPPEVFDKNPIITLQSDIFSFGMTIFEIVTQKVPFHELCSLKTEEGNEFIKNSVRRGVLIKFHEVIDDSMCCKELIALIEKMCHKVPNERPTIKKVLQEMKAIISKS